MKYTSPFHLLPKRDSGLLTNDELKRWKKELLLQFDLQQSTTIDIKEQEYDKNDILQIFDLLKDKPEYHWRLYQNKPLLEFIEKGQIHFFKHKKNWTDFEDVLYRNWLAQSFISAYGEMIYQWTSVKRPRTIRSLKKLYKSGFKLPHEWRDEAYVKTYRSLAHFVKQAENTLENEPIVKRYKLTLNPEIKLFVDVYYADLLEVLPENFEGIREDYGNFAHNVIATVFNRRRTYSSIEKKTLRLIRNAAKIDVKIRDDDYSKGLLDGIKSYRRERISSIFNIRNILLIIWLTMSIIQIGTCTFQ